MSNQGKKISVFCPTKNEGPYLLEWIAWYRMLGFSDILMLTNDCTDGSDALLQALADRGYIRFINHIPALGQTPLQSAYAVAKKDRQLLDADWVMTVDVDEFLQVFKGDGSVHALINGLEQPYLGMAIHWRIFGDNGRNNWEDKLIRCQFTQAAQSFVKPNSRFKSIFRNLKSFRAINSHTPRGFNGPWGNENIWIDSAGVPLRGIRLTNSLKGGISTANRRITHEVAQINHYAVKYTETFALKRTQKSGARLTYRHDAKYHLDYNINDIRDVSALSREDEFNVEYHELTSDPEIVEMHHACCANYVRKLCDVAKSDYSKDARYLDHRELAGVHYTEQN